MKTEKAYKTLQKAFKKDPDYARTWKDNIACCIMDNAKGYTQNKEKRDKLAEKIFDMLFK